MTPTRKFLLAGAALGTLEPRSIIQPIREAAPRASYFEAEATRINLQAFALYIVRSY